MVEPKENQNRRIILWAEIIHLLDHISHQIKSSNKYYNSIYGIKRGGLIPAVILSHKLDIPIVSRNGINKNTLIVDDICDSGYTLMEFKKGYQQCLKIEHLDVVVLFQKNTATYFANYIGENLVNNDWLVFPWEN
jgi:uncharacterized protein